MSNEDTGLPISVLKTIIRTKCPANCIVVSDCSSMTILECMNYLASLNLVNLDELMTMGFYNPLELIGFFPEDLAQNEKVCFDEKRSVFYTE